MSTEATSLTVEKLIAIRDHLERAYPKTEIRGTFSSLARLRANFDRRDERIPDSVRVTESEHIPEGLVVFVTTRRGTDPEIFILDLNRPQA